MNANWPFQDPKDLAVFTTKEVLENRRPILIVTHDVEDGAWQFHSGDSMQESDARIISLDEALTIDPTIAALADMPTGWIASRTTPSHAWKRERI